MVIGIHQHDRDERIPEDPLDHPADTVKDRFQVFALYKPFQQLVFAGQQCLRGLSIQAVVGCGGHSRRRYHPHPIPTSRPSLLNWLSKSRHLAKSHHSFHHVSFPISLI